MTKIFFFLVCLLIPFSSVRADDINQCGSYVITGVIERALNHIQLQLYSKSPDEIDLNLVGDQALRAIAYEKFNVKVTGVISKALVHRQGDFLVQNIEMVNYRPDRENGGDSAKLLRAVSCLKVQAKSK